MRCTPRAFITDLERALAGRDYQQERSHGGRGVHGAGGRRMKRRRVRDLPSAANGGFVSGDVVRLRTSAGRPAARRSPMRGAW